MKATKIQRSPFKNWQDLGFWNCYFFAKFALLWSGKLNFHPLDNVTFLAFLLFPIGSVTLQRIRHYSAIPIGIALFYHDTWLPSIYTILDQGGYLLQFNTDYLFDLFNRFINWNMIKGAFVILVTYILISPWIRITVLTIAILVWLACPKFNLSETPIPTVTSPSSVPLQTKPNIQNQNGPATNENITAYLNQFYTNQASQQTHFPVKLTAEAQPFDILIIQICSLAWSDLKAVDLVGNPFWSQFDLMFNHFNSASSYSGPASIRLLRASCGQDSQKTLYQPADKHCFIMNNLAQLGFTNQLMLDHTGTFGDYLSDLRKYGQLTAPLMPQKNLGIQLDSFNGQPIYSDKEQLSQWLTLRNKSTDARSVTFYNIIPLHDGNHFINQSKPADYRTRVITLFDTLEHFFTMLEQSSRKVMVIVIPEHGANMSGDSLQMPGLRDIPSLSITEVPVGIKFFGIPPENHPVSTIQIDKPSSYLAISDLIAQLVPGELFHSKGFDLNQLIKKLPTTPAVSENENSVVVDYHGSSYIRLIGEVNWIPYPSNQQARE
jgi:cellulose synthase operon protein YhjU